MVDRYHQQKFLAMALIVVLGIFLFSAFFRFINVFVIGLIIFTVFKPLYDRVEKRMGDNASATFIIVLSFLVVVIPGIIIGSFAIDEIIKINKKTADIYFLLEDDIEALDEKFPEMQVKDRFLQMIEKINDFISGLIKPIVQNTANLLVTLVLMYFFLFFLLTNTKEWRRGMYEIIPFSKENSKKFLLEFDKVTYSTIVGSGLIGLVQGSLITISFLLTGVSGPYIWGIIAIILSFIPLIGVSLVWVPVSIFFFLTGQIGVGIAFTLFHLIITSNIDTVLRTMINRKIANIHPLTSVFGVFFGLSFFGLIGIILGPLLISYFFLLISLYKEEYM